MVGREVFPTFPQIPNDFFEAAPKAPSSARGFRPMRPPDDHLGLSTGRLMMTQLFVFLRTKEECTSVRELYGFICRFPFRSCPGNQEDPQTGEPCIWSDMETIIIEFALLETICDCNDEKGRRGLPSSLSTKQRGYTQEKQLL